MHRCRYACAAQYAWIANALTAASHAVTARYVNTALLQRIWHALTIHVQSAARTFCSQSKFTCKTIAARPVNESVMQNAWMNDVESWMSQQCFDHYQRLIAQANELDKGKGKGSAGKGKLGPRQMALQLKKQRFNQFLSDLEPAVQ